MDEPSNFLIALIILLLLSTIFLLLHRRNHRFLPGPPGWPIIGNLLDIGTLPHRTLTDMKQKYGDIIGLRLGSMNCMVILSAKAASELFKTHDLSFADRTITQTMRTHGFNQGALSLLPYGPTWRVLRKLVTVDMLSNRKLNETAFIRRKCMDDMLQWIEEESCDNKGSGRINVAHVVFLMTFNLMGNLVLSCDLLDPKSKQGSEFMKAIITLMKLTEHVSVADFFPWLKWVDIQGWNIKRKIEKCICEAVELASNFVKERVEETKKKNLMENRSKDFLDVLLEFEGNGKDEPDKISDHIINIFILEMFVAVSENTSSTIEWALTELLRNPETMNRAKAELATVIGTKRKVEESDIDNLPYLQAVIKETLRLYAPVPFLVPRRARQDIKFMGYQIPKNTQVLVNAWAIGRDPQVWDDPLRFNPERFMDSNIDYKGQHFEFIPFGAGRRFCVGLSLAHRVVNLILWSLLHQYHWELDANINPATMDMREILGITMRKLEPLLVVPKKTSM